MLPHHHHEEEVCYTSTHCETETDHHANDIQDNTHHSHDHSSGEQTQHCLSLEFYVKSNFNKSSKRFVNAYLMNFANSSFNTLIPNHLQQDNDIKTKEKLFKFITEYNVYSVFVKHELPLRGPPQQLSR